MVLTPIKQLYFCISVIAVLTGVPKKVHNGLIVSACLQESTELQQENAKLKERCNVLEGEVRALRQDMTALQRHLHMPVTLSALSFDDSTPLPTNNKRSKTQVCLANRPVGLVLMSLHCDLSGLGLDSGP